MTTTASGATCGGGCDSPLTFQAPASLAGTYGDFNFNTSSGAWVYTLNNADPDTTALAAGAVVHELLTVKSSDGTASQVIDVTITGSNDAATISGAATGAVTEDAVTTTASGALTVADVDSLLTFQAPTGLAGTYGNFTFNAGTGVWVYTLNNADPDTNALAAGAVVHELLTVKSSDGTASQVIDVTITGSNDAATISGTATGAVTEDAVTTTASGALTVVDVDSPLTFQAPTGLAGTYGNFTFNTGTGAWVYTLNNADPDTNALAAGAVVHELLTVKSSDGTASQVIDVTITGSNDAATISGTATGAVTEDSVTTTASGALTVADVDSSLTFQAPTGLAGTYGDFTFNAGSGAWVYTLNNADPDTNALAAGAVVHELLTVKSSDGTASQVIDVTITGSNDAATISGTATGAVTEDAVTTTASGALTVADVDSPLTFQAPTGLAGTYGNFTFNTGTGAWVYTLNNADPDTNALAAGAVVHELLTVKSSDGTASQVIDVTITGSNDAATISGTATGAVTENAVTTTASGTLTVVDVDSPLTFQAPNRFGGHLWQLHLQHWYWSLGLYAEQC